MPAQTPATKALALLHAVAVLQFYNEDPDAVEIFQELEECYSKLSSGKLKSGEGTPEFLVEILLAMVARSSSLMRQVSQQVLDAFTPLMSTEAIQLLTEPLAADENEKGQQALFSTEEEDMDGAGEDEEGEGIVDLDELGSDVDMADILELDSEAPGETAGKGDKDEDEDGSDEDESVEDDGADEAEDEELRALGNALDQVLQGHSHNKSKEEAGGDDSDSDMSDMTDSEMTALDDKLAAVFREKAKKAGKKQARKDAKDTVVNFKHRVLDLVAIFVKKEAAASNPLVFEVLMPLLQLVRKTTAKPLSNKAQDILLSVSKNLKKARGNTAQGAGSATETDHEVDGDALMALLKEVHGEASKDPSHTFAKAASTASLAVASVLCSSTDKTQEVFQLYAQTQLAWYQKEIRVQMIFFQDWLNWCQSYAAASASA